MWDDHRAFHIQVREGRSYMTVRQQCSKVQKMSIFPPTYPDNNPAYTYSPRISIKGRKSKNGNFKKITKVYGMNYLD